jgi:hypothetical protein
MPSAAPAAGGTASSSGAGPTTQVAPSQTIAASPAGRQNSGAAPAGPAAYAWLQEVTATTHIDDGTTRTDPVNPAQFAAPETAQALAAQLGLKSFGTNLAGFSSYSSDMQMLNASGDPAEAALNAGLVADTFARYGSGPGSYGRFLIDRDLAMLRGETIPDPWASR